MAQNFVELKQEDVFIFMDKELKENRISFEEKILQKTKNNFTAIIIVNLIALTIAFTGMYIVYNAFKASEYKMVGGEKSIKGLEEVLYKELQKKATADLQKKQLELMEAKSKLEQLNQQMDTFREEQKRIYEERLKKAQEEINSKMKKELEELSKNKALSLEKQEEIKKKYEEMLKLQKQSLESEIQKEINKKEEELNKIKEEQKKLSLLSDNLQKELQKTKAEIDKANEEFNKKLQEEQRKGKKALEEVQLKLEEKQKLENFNFQVNNLYASAIESYNNKQYDKVREKLMGILNLYNNKPKDLLIPKDRELVDKFFVETIKDYLSIKESGIFEDKAKLDDLVISIKSLKDFGVKLEKGDFNNKENEVSNRISNFEKKIPDIFDFYKSYNNYKVKQLDNIVFEELKQANKLLEEKKYQSALSAYLNILRKYPDSSYRTEILNKISGSLFAINAESAFTAEEVNKKAQAIFNSGIKNMKENNYDEAIANFKDIIINYPTSSFLNDSLNNLIKANNEKFLLTAQNISNEINKRIRENSSKYEDRISNIIIENENKIKKISLDFEKRISNFILSNTRLQSDNIKMILESNKNAQNQKAKKLYEEALNFENSLNYDNAQRIYASIILNYPNSSYIDKSLEGIERTIIQKSKKEGSTSLSTTQDIQQYIIGRIIEIIGDELVLYIDKIENITENSIVYIYRKENNNFKYIGEAKIIELTPITCKAQLVKTVEEVRTGDSIYKR